MFQYGSAHAQQSSQRVLIQWNNIVIQQTTKSTAYSVNFHPIMLIAVLQTPLIVAFIPGSRLPMLRFLFS